MRARRLSPRAVIAPNAHTPLLIMASNQHHTHRSQEVSPPTADSGANPSADDAAADVFREYIRDAPGVCDTCFRRVKDYTRPPSGRWFDQHTRSAATLKTCVTSMSTPGKDGMYCHPPPKNHDTDEYQNRPAYGRIICDACGHIDRPNRGFGSGLLDADDDLDAALTKPVLERAADRCVSRLREAGLSVHRHAVFSAVDTLKSKPHYATRDADIVRAALTIGVRRADQQQPQPTPTTTDADDDTDTDPKRQ